MQITNIILKPNRVLIKPTDDGSSFSLERKKYERRSIAEVMLVSDYVANIKPGDRIIYDDSKSIDFTLDGVQLSIIHPEEIVAFIKEEVK